MWAALISGLCQWPDSAQHTGHFVPSSRMDPAPDIMSTKGVLEGTWRCVVVKHINQLLKRSLSGVLLLRPSVLFEPSPCDLCPAPTSAIIAGSSSSSVQCGGQYRSVRVTHMHINLVAACSIFVIWVVHCFPQNGCLLVGGGRYFTTWKWHRDAQKPTIFTAKVKYMRGKHCKFTLNSYFHPFIATASSTQQSQYVSALCSNPGTWSKWRHIHWKAVDHRVQLFSFCLNCQHTNSWASIWLSMIFEQS